MTKVLRNGKLVLFLWTMMCCLLSPVLLFAENFSLAVTPVTTAEQDEGYIRIEISSGDLDQLTDGDRIRVSLSVTPGTATVGVDYIAPLDTILLSKRFPSYNIAKIEDDAIYEGDETFDVTITEALYQPDPSPGGAHTISYPPGATTVTIDDDDFENYEVSVSPTELAEEDEGFVNLGISSGNLDFLDAGDTIRVTYTVTPDTATEGADYVPSAPTTRDLTKATPSVTIAQVIDDAIVERAEIFDVTITSATYIPAAAGPHTVTYDPATTPVVITNAENENYSLTVSPTTVIEEVGGQITLGVTSGDLDLLDAGDSIRVWYTVTPGTASQGADYVLSAPSIINLTSDTPSVDIVEIIDDDLIERTEDFEVTITGATYITAGANAHTISYPPGATNITITNDDFDVRLSPTTVIEEDAGFISLSTGDLNLLHDNDIVRVTFNVVPDTASEGLDYIPTATTTIDFTKATPEVDIVEILDEDLVELDEAFDVNITSATYIEFDAGSESIAYDPLFTVTIENNDDFSVATQEPVIPPFYEDGAAAANPEFCILFSAPVAWNIDIAYDISGTAVLLDDYTLNPLGDRITFAAGETVHCIDMNVVIDTNVEPDEDFAFSIASIDHSITPSTPGSIGTPSQTEGIILNDDHYFTMSSSDESFGTIETGPYSIPAEPNPLTLVLSRGEQPVVDMVANDCYHINDVLVDSVSIGGDFAPMAPTRPITYTYTFDPVTSDRTIHADFVRTSYMINTTVLNPDNGTITDSMEVDCGSSGQTIVATANNGYTITWFKVDGVDQVLPGVETEFSYTIDSEMTEDVEIEVAFSNKVILTSLHSHGDVETTPAANEGVIDVDYGAFLPLLTYSYDFTLQGPRAIADKATVDGEDCLDPDSLVTLEKPVFDGDGVLINTPEVDEYCNYIDTAEGTPLWQTEDARLHTYHLSIIRVDGAEVSARCRTSETLLPAPVDPLDPGDSFYSNYTSSDYHESSQCYYDGLTNITEDREVEVFFTSYIDLATIGAGSILENGIVLVDATAGDPEDGMLEVEAESDVTFAFDPIDDWYISDVQVRKETPDEDRRVEGIENLPSMALLGGRSSYTFENVIEQDWALKSIFKVNEFTLQATSTFEAVLFTDAGLTELVTKEADNGKKIVEVGNDESFYVVIDDPDFAVVGLNIDSNFIGIDQIREFAADPGSNPDSATFEFLITDYAGQERLEVRFVNVQVSHNLEVRDFDGVILSDIPLDAQNNPNPPTVMFVLDDSGSMDWEFLVKGVASGVYLSGRDDFNDDNGDRYFYYLYDFPIARVYSGYEMGSHTYRNEWRARFSQYNTMFYRPSVTYAPWPSFTGEIEIEGTSYSSQLPSGADFADQRAHADMYRPRYHPWHNSDCSDALNKSIDRRDGLDVSAMSLSGCDDTQTFNLDGTFMPIGLGNKIDIDQDGAVRTGDWTEYSHGDCLGDTYLYNNGTGSATYSFTTEADGEHDVLVSWRTYGTRSDEIQYNVTCGTCTPAVDQTVVLSQLNEGYYEDGMVSLGTFTFQAGNTVNVEVERAPSATGTMSIDAVRLQWGGFSNLLNAHYFTWDDVDGDGEYDSEDEDIWLVNLSDPISYTRLIDKAEPVSVGNLDAISYTAENLPASLKDSLMTYVSPDDPNAFVLERQNFADWFSYYRNRAYSATAGISLAIEKMENVNVGIESINHSATYGISQSALPVRVWGERDKTKYLYYLLYEFRTAARGTPLVPAFRDVADYLDGDDTDSGGVIDSVGQSGITLSGGADDSLSPFAIIDDVEKNGDRCKETFSIIVTDGFWNGSTAGGEVSYTIPEDHLGPVYNNTLAETAYDYFQRQDLMNDADGDQQTMRTYGVAFGVTGELTYSSSCSFTDPTGCPDWNWPRSNRESTIDDLWHASVNGGGEFLSADSPDTLVKALAGIINSIGELVGSSSSLAASGDELYLEIDGNARLYQPSWDSNGWFGDLKAYSVDPDTGDVNATPLWSASETLSSRLSGAGSEPSNRIIATYNDETKSGVRFDATTISDDQLLRLYPYYSPSRTSADVLDWLRGDAVDDVNYCIDSLCFPEFRSRSFEDDGVTKNKLLGDIVNSQGVFQNYYNTEGDSIGGIVFIGANDGMLHAFSAKDGDEGKELFAYIPNLVFHNLRVLADPEFSAGDHRMFVDSSPVIETIKYTSGMTTVNKTILVGGLGKGGKGYFALDISDAWDITSEEDLADRVLWEYPAPPEKIVDAQQASFTADSIQLATPLSDAQKTELTESKYFTVLGANYNSGAINITNDGTYELKEVSADNKTIFITKSRFSVISDVTISLLESTSDPDMGYSYARPALVRSNDRNIGADGWVVIFGNGYGSDNGEANLYILNPLTGERITDGSSDLGIMKTNEGPFNGMSSAKLIDIDNNLTVDYVYAGDLLGNMWKFDLYLNPQVYDDSDTGPKAREAKNWQVAFCTGSDTDYHCRGDVVGMNPKPLFSTMTKQPITGAPDIMRHQSYLGYMVIFGTGKYLGWTDLISTDQQSAYGIWDWAPDYYDLGYHGARADNVVGGVKHIELTNWTDRDILGAPVHTLLEQTFLFEGEISEDLNGDGVLSTEEDIDEDGVIDVYSYYRIPTYHEGDWSTAYNDELSSHGLSPLPYAGSERFRVPLANLGWVFDLPGKIESGVRAEGERMINDTIIRDGRVIMVTFGLSGDKCGASAYSFLNERDAETGGMLFTPVYDLTEDGVIDDEDRLYFFDTSGIGDDDSTDMNPTDESFEGRLSNPVIGVRDPGPGPDGKAIEDKYMSGSAFDHDGGGGTVVQHVLESAERRGVYYWKQVR